MQYDYIIAGTGCSGLMLAYFLTESSLKDKKILLLDSELKNKDDRTWCFWEAKKSPFESIVHFRWNQILFCSAGFEKKMDIAPYQYKMIRGIDFYQFVQEKLRHFPNISFLQRKITAIETLDNQAQVVTESETFQAKHVFNSCFRPKVDLTKHIHLFQHFWGWVIETDKDSFDPACPTLMDFTIPQAGETRFMYVMPTSKRKALVEATVFSAELCTEAEYRQMLEEYIYKKLKISNFHISHQENGAIPMTNYPFPTHSSPAILNIGTAGGNVKASTGYAFQNIQKQMQYLVAWLAAGNENASNFKPKSQSRFRLYDSLLLYIMQQKRLSTSLIFSLLFQKNPPQRIFRFLDEETHFGQDIQIMYSVPSLPFVKALLEMLWKS